jgi:cyclin L
MSSHLSNPLATADHLSSSSSQLDGIPEDLETSMIFGGSRLTQIAGSLLRLPQDIIAQAIVIFMRFWVGAEGGSLREYAMKVRYPTTLLTELFPIQFSFLSTELLS